MKTALIIALAVSAGIVSVSGNAQTYQWKDSKGRTVISDTPPPGATKTSQTIGSTTPSTSAPVEKTADSPKTTAEKDLEFKKRQQEAREKADKEAKEKAAAADKQENCERARRNLAALETSQPLTTLDENGQRKTMDNSQRDQEMERARRFLAESCK